jgi:hypothetical protein
MQVATVIGGKLVVWKPLPGLDPSLGERALLTGAVAYGMAIHAGKPEAEAHQEAEKVMYRSVFHITY